MKTKPAVKEQKKRGRPPGSGITVKVTLPSLVNPKKAKGEPELPLPAFVDKHLAIELLFESPTNPRTVFLLADMRDLVNSVRAMGVIQPLIVRRDKGKREQYEIIAGARRYRAAKEVRLDAVPCRIVDLTDEQLLDMQLVENLQRVPPHPLDEADGFARVMALPGKTAEQVAERVGKDSGYVYRRLRLTKLVDKVKDAFRKGIIELGHAMEIAKLADPAAQMEAFALCFPHKWDGTKRAAQFNEPVDQTPSQLRQAIEDDLLRKLAKVPWKLDDPDVLPEAGPCTTCTKRSKANLQLFDKGEADDACLDRTCFEKKRAGFVHITIQRAAEKGKDLFVILQGEHGSYRPADQQKCESSERALYGDGHNLGQFAKICRDKKCKVHWSRGASGVSVGSAGAKATPEQKWDSKLALENRKIDNLLRVRLVNAIAFGGMPKGPDAARSLMQMVGNIVIEHPDVNVDEAAAALSVKPLDMMDDPEKFLEDELERALDSGRFFQFCLALGVSHIGGPLSVEAICNTMGIPHTKIRAEIADPIMDEFNLAKSKALGKLLPKAKKGAKLQ